MRPRSGFRDTFSLGGWLFADLMLALMVLFLASNTVTGPAIAVPTRTATATPTATANSTGVPPVERTATFTSTPTPTYTRTPTATHTATATSTATATRTPTATALPCQLTLVLRKHAITVPGAGDGAGPSAAQLRKAFAPFRGQRLGLLLTFGHDSTPDPGEALASSVNKQLASLLPGMFTRETIREAYHYIDSGNAGTVDFNAYFFASTCGKR